MTQHHTTDRQMEEYVSTQTLVSPHRRQDRSFQASGLHEIGLLLQYRTCVYMYMYIQWLAYCITMYMLKRHSYKLPTIHLGVESHWGYAARIAPVQPVQPAMHGVEIHRDNFGGENLLDSQPIIFITITLPPRSPLPSPLFLPYLPPLSCYLE